MYYVDSPEFTIICWILHYAIFFCTVDIIPLSGTEKKQRICYNVNQRKSPTIKMKTIQFSSDNYFPLNLLKIKRGVTEIV